MERRKLLKSLLVVAAAPKILSKINPKPDYLENFPLSMPMEATPIPANFIEYSVERGFFYESYTYSYKNSYKQYEASLREELGQIFANMDKKRG